METVLLGVTAASLFFGLAMGIVAWRAARAEELRAAARVASLSAAVSEGTGALLAPTPRVAETAGAAALTGFRSEGETYDETVLHQGFLAGSPAAQGGATRQRGLLAAAAIVAVGITIAGAIRMSGGATSNATSPAVSTPLELLSLRHEREGGRLAVAGLVRNPEPGAAVERLSAVVLLFDQQGALVTSAKAPVDHITLASGDESPFVVELDAPPTVTRYRVSFRAGDHTLPHVDRRAEPPVATTGAVGK